MAKKLGIEDSNGVLQRQIDVDDTTKTVKIYDNTDAEIMDIEAHGSRHADGGADPLPASSISTDMLQDSAVTNPKIASAAVTSDKVAAKSQYRNVEVTTGVAIGASGSPATIVTLDITSEYNTLLPLHMTATPSGLGTSETATFSVVATLDDGSTVTLFSKTTAAGSTATVYVTPGSLYYNRIGDGKRVVSLAITAESSATSTTATATGTITALEIYI